MPSIKELILLSTLLFHALPVGAAPAPADGYRGIDQHLPLHAGIEPCEDCGEGDPGHEDGKDGGDEGGVGGETTMTVTDCGDVPTSTVTITTPSGDGIATATITETTTLTEGAAGDSQTVTLIQTITDCTASTTDLTTITADGSTITETFTTPGPTITETTTEIFASETITDPGVTSTETLTITEAETSTITDTTTLTEHQVITEISSITTTETETLNITSTTTEISTTTVTADDCTPTNGGDTGPGYGSCSDPTIRYEYNGYEYVYTTNNQVDFPFGESPTIGSPAALICNRLESPCNAPAATVAQCRAAIDAVSSLTGQEAADEWNELITAIV
ncbi:hypothetical protein BJX70DRAFT_395155 [Aspergillus crustosus]